jgi:hypothetical protein
MFKNRIRLPFFLSKAQFPVERNIFRKADGSSKVLSAVVRNTYEGKTDQLPEDWHRKLVIALSHDEVTVEDNRFLSDVVLDGDYDIDLQDFLNYPLAQSNFKIQVTPFNATNSNCQTCDEIAQLDLVDDTTATVYNEGTTNEFPFSILLNDEICCYPFVVSISSFNTLYFSAVSVDQDGIVTFAVNASVPDIANVLLATYRVTCPNGGYDEANIYVGIDGTSTECVAPAGLEFDIVTGIVSWDIVVDEPAGGYDWYLYDADDIYTVIASGNIVGFSIDLSEYLAFGESYIFAVQANCGGGNLSAISTIEFTQPAVPPEPTCGSFAVTYIQEQSNAPVSITYYDCNAVLQTVFFAFSSSQILCMLVTEDDPTTPFGFAVSTTDISVTYIEPC